MKHFILLVLFSGLYCTMVSAQDAAVNRRKIINMVLGQSHVKANAANYNHAGIYANTSAPPSAPQGFRTLSSIPKYCLAKGAVICRFEEYVQLHSPFKLNIGVGGE
jgi:hypothetical protein